MHTFAHLSNTSATLAAVIVGVSAQHWPPQSVTGTGLRAQSLSSLVEEKGPRSWQVEHFGTFAGRLHLACRRLIQVFPCFSVGLFCLFCL